MTGSLSLRDRGGQIKAISLLCPPFWVHAQNYLWPFYNPPFIPCRPSSNLNNYPQPHIIKEGPMTLNSPEKEFKQKAFELFKALKERVGHLKETGSVTAQILKLLEDAESFYEGEKFLESEKKYDEALSKIETVEISHRSKPMAWRLFWIETGYLVILLLLAYLTYKWPKFIMWDGLVNMHLQTAWFGALGGITIAIYGIYEHTQKRDFDPRYELWYISKPIIGGIFGWFIWLIFLIGLISVQGVGERELKHPELPFVIAFLSGFSERFTLKMIDKLMNVLTSFEEKQAIDKLK